MVRGARFDTESGTVVLQADDADWLFFRKPRRVLKACRIEDVRTVLKEAEADTARGKWVAGFVSYEAAPAFDSAFAAHELTTLPLIWFGVYDTPQTLHALPEGIQPFETGEWNPSIGSESYAQALAQVKEYIAAGDTYQVNFTLRLQTAFSGSPWTFFRQLVRSQRPRYAAYVHTGEHVLLSASPELFFELQGTEISCRPMKGTAARGLSAEEDFAVAQRLQSSAKERAENVMIVDMVRNDLSRIARPGSVSVPELFTVEKYPTLLQLTSTVTASTDAPLAEIFNALFPCASITGAPKVRTTQIIRELESTPRGIYTGCIGYVSPEHTARFNVAIRTVDIHLPSGTAGYGTGGGIVWDSQTGGEFDECRLKAAVLTTVRPEFSLIETLLWKPQTGYFLLDRHLQRLAASAGYFGFRFEKDSIVKSLENAVRDDASQTLKVRLLLSEDGSPQVSAEPLENRFASRRWRVALAQNPIQSQDKFLYHKTTMRAVYDTAKNGSNRCDDVILWNERDEVTESTVANVVVKIKDAFFTPPISCGLLGGTYRAHLLAAKRITERVITLEELRAAERVYLINSVRGWIPAELVS